MSRRGGRGGGAQHAYRERMRMMERPVAVPTYSEMQPRYPPQVAVKGNVYTVTTATPPPKKLQAILEEVARRKRAAYEEEQKNLRAMAQQASAAMKGQEPNVRVSGLSALGGEEQEDVDAEFLSDDFIKNCTQMDVERLRKRIAALQAFQEDLGWLKEKVTGLEKDHKLGKYKEPTF